jgi:hypothetical protein
MLKKSLTAISLLIVLSFLASPTLGHGTKRRKARSATAQSPAINPTVVAPTVKTKKPDHFVGGSDDGSSIRRKQPGRRRHNH